MRRTPALLAAAAAAILVACPSAGAGTAHGPTPRERAAPDVSGAADGAPKLLGFQAFTADRHPFAGDGRLLTTVSPNGDRLRRAARIRVLLTGRARVTFRVTRTDGAPQVLHEASATLARGWHVFTWVPSPKVTPRTYLTRFEVVGAAGAKRLYGPRDARTGRVPTTPVIRVLGVDAGFTRESYVEGEAARLRIETDARRLQLQVFHAGHEGVPTYDNTVMNGVPAGEPVTIDWSGHGNGPRTVTVPVGAWPSGLYFAKLVADDGRVGYAPFVLRPSTLGAIARVAVVMPTNTWQAYNFRDEKGNGFGDTWYAKGAQSTVRLGRAFLRRGVPPQYRKYDLGFLRWLATRGKAFEMLSESDLETVASPDLLTAAYDLIILPGHTEYVTEHEYDLLQGYRDLGGNLAFLSSNNVFWQVKLEGRTLRRTTKWRDLGRPESALIGVQYRANDDGRTQRPYVVRAASTVPWLFRDTGLADGATFGPLGGYGIEIDATTPSSPPGTLVIAEIPEIWGPGLTAQMTYYETAAGAKVFAAGSMDFGGTALEFPVGRILENLWEHLSVP